MKPTYDRILVELLDDPEAMPKHGLVIPDTAERVSRLALVVEVGDGIVSKTGRVLPLSVLPGQKVILSASSVKALGTEVEVGGRKLLMVRESQVVGVLA